MSFYKKIREEVSKLRVEYAYKDDGTAFGHFVIAECFRKIFDFGFDGTEEEFDKFLQKHVVDMCSDLGNDVILVNKETRQIFFFQCKFSEFNLLTTEEIRKNKIFFDWLLHLAPEPLKPNRKLRDIIENEIRDILELDDYELVFVYVNAEFPQETRTDMMALFNNFRDQKIRFEVQFYDYRMLDDLFEDQAIPQNEVELKTIPGESFSKTLRFYGSDGSEDTNLRTLVATIRANTLKGVVQQHRERLFALNVRYYKGEKGSINRKIKDEYSRGGRSNFWILNNGINAVCKSFTLDGNTLSARNFQIVNGGQTAKTLTKIVNDLPDNVHILMRLTEIEDAAKIGTISKQIATASNNQNAISDRDLHSGDRIQEELFERFQKIGIFYDKKDGEWSTISDKKRFQDPNRKRAYRKVSNTEVGVDYFSFFLQTPASSKGRDKLVFSDLFYDQIFDQSASADVQCRKLMFAYRLSQRVGSLRVRNEAKYEILQNRHIHSYLLALCALLFARSVTQMIRSPEEVANALASIDWKIFIDSANGFELKLPKAFDTFEIEVIESLEFALDVKKEVMAEKNAKWLAKETDNWLKRDDSYKEILTKVVKRLSL